MQPLQALTLQNDRGTSWDQQYEPASLSNLPASVDLRSKFEDAGIEVYDQVYCSFNTALHYAHYINTKACHNRHASIHARPMQFVPRGDTRKPKSILDLHRLDFSCTITNGSLKEQHPKITARVSPLDANRLPRTACALRTIGVTMKKMKPKNLLRKHTMKGYSI